ncbi:hypothetical protein P3L10_033082 [Capsicum annuum]
MIENLKEHVFRLEESIKDIIDFVKKERLRREKKEKQKKRDKYEDDNDIKEALLEGTALEQASINVDEAIIHDVAAVVEKENPNEEKKDIAEKENKNKFSIIDEFLNEVTQDIYKMQVEDENVECLDNV